MNNTKITFHVREDVALLGDKIFEAQPLYGMKTDNYMYAHLKKMVTEAGGEIHTQDILPDEAADYIMCLNETDFFKTYTRSEKNKKLLLILSEPPVYNNKDWNPEIHDKFDLVFTYEKDLVDNKKYFLYNFPIDFQQLVFEPDTEECYENKMLCAIIAGTISINPQAEELKSLLYERFKVIKWFNKKAPENLHYFSRINPMKYCSYYKAAGILSKIQPVHNVVKQQIFNNSLSKVYKGFIPAEEKNSFLTKYKFSISFENSGGINGIISEKIFDAFFALNVPVYLGAKDVLDYIPQECFINYKNFKSVEDLNHYLVNMDFKTYSKYQKNILKYLASDNINIFTSDAFCKNLLSGLVSNNSNSSEVTSVFHLHPSLNLQP